MGLRFRKSFKIGPGTRLNVGSKSWGISTGRRGFRISSNTRTGSHVSAGIPGSGLSYRQRLGSGRGSSSSGDVQGGAGLGCLMLWGLLSPSSCGCFGLIVLIAALMLLMTVIRAAVVAGKVLLAFYIGFLPLIVSLGAVVVMIRYSIGPSQSRHVTGVKILGGGLLANIVFLLFAPQRFPPTAIAQILAPQPAVAAQPSPAGAPSLFPTETPAPMPAVASQAPQTDASSTDISSARGAVPESPSDLRIVQSVFSIHAIKGDKFSSTVYQNGENIGVPSELRKRLCEVRWRIQLYNAGRRRILYLEYVPEFLDSSGQSVPRDIGLNGDNGYVEQSLSGNGALEIRSLPRLEMSLSAGQVRDVVLRELVSREAAERIRNVRITLTSTWQESPNNEKKLPQKRPATGARHTER